MSVGNLELCHIDPSLVLQFNRVLVSPAQVETMLADDHVMLQDQVQVLFLHLGRHAVSASEILGDEGPLLLGERRLQLFSFDLIDGGHLPDVLGIQLLNLTVGDVLEPDNELISFELD